MPAEKVILSIDRKLCQEPMSEQAERCVHIAENAINYFVEKNEGYGNTAYNLGAAGQYADMNRKFGKLKRTLWEGKTEVPGGETNEQMLMDLIGHCLLTIDFLREGYFR